MTRTGLFKISKFCQRWNDDEHLDGEYHPLCPAAWRDSRTKKEFTRLTALCRMCERVKRVGHKEENSFLQQKLFCLFCLFLAPRILQCLLSGLRTKYTGRRRERERERFAGGIFPDVEKQGRILKKKKTTKSLKEMSKSTNRKSGQKRGGSG